MVRRKNTWADVDGTGRVVIDLGHGVTLDTATLGGSTVQDTGWRSIPIANGSTSRTGAGTIRIRRVGDLVRCQFDDVGLTDGSGSSVVLLGSEINNGYAGPPTGSFVYVGTTGSTTSVNWMRFSTSLWWTYAVNHLGSSNTRTGVALDGEINWYTTDPFPTV